MRQINFPVTMTEIIVCTPTTQHIQEIAFKNTKYFISWKQMLCKGNPKVAPGIKPILFTQVHYHLHRRSYLHERTHKHHKQRHIHFAVLLGFFNQFQIVAVNITVLFRHSDLIPVTLNTLCKYIIQPQFIIIFKYCKAAISGLTFFLSNPRYFAATVTTVSFFFDISQ